MTINSPADKDKRKPMTPVSLAEARKLIPGWEGFDLPPKFLKFIGEWLTNGHNASDAYEMHIARKGVSRNVINSCASECMARPKIQVAIKQIMAHSLGKYKTDLEDRIIKQLWRRAFYDVEMFVNQDGSPKFEKLEDVPEEWRCCIDSIESQYFGKDADVKVIKMKLANRDTAVDRLAKYIEMFKESPPTLNLGGKTLDTLRHMVDGFKRGGENVDIARETTTEPDTEFGSGQD